MLGAILWMIVIFLFSAQNGQESQSDSDRIGMFIGRIFVEHFEDLSHEEQLLFCESVSYPIRKGAHMTEYAILSLLLFGALYDPRSAGSESDVVSIPSFMMNSTPESEILQRKYEVYVRIQNFRLAQRASGIALMITLSYAVIDEIHQLFVSERSGQFTDVLIDGMGAVIALGIVLLIYFVKIRRLHRRNRELIRSRKRQVQV